jgi:uncharacterized iron-regulated protein
LKRGYVVFLLVVFVMTAFAEDEEDRVYLLNIGDESLRKKIMSVSSDTIHSGREGKAVTFPKMIDEMKGSRFIYVGETHNSLPMHDIQYRIIRALYEQDKNLSIGLEMFPVTQQEVLNKWSLGLLTKSEFIREAEWYVTWNFNFAFYEKIFDFAKANRIPLYALNVSRELISKIRMKGWESLSEEDKKLVPKPDLSNEEHRRLIRTIFEETELPHQMKGRGLDMMFEGLYRAQSAWDEVMASNAVQAVKKDGRRMVVLAGSGHLLYNLGINNRVYGRNQAPFKTVVCLEVPEHQTHQSVSRSLADYVWGLSEEEQPAYPSVGLKFKTFDGLDNLVIERDPIDGVAKGQDFKKGDVVLDVDGQTYANINELRIYLSRFSWGEKVKFRLLREAKDIEVVLEFRMED